jgi:trk system potassium uptake protein TrkA
MEVLKEAGIETCDAFVAATGGDNTNVVIAQVAQEEFHVRCAVARVLDPLRAEFYASRGLRTVCPTRSAIEMLDEAVRSCEVV